MEKCHTLTCAIPRPSVTLWCVSTQDQTSHCYVELPYILWTLQWLDRAPDRNRNTVLLLSVISKCCTVLCDAWILLKVTKLCQMEVTENSYAFVSYQIMFFISLSLKSDAYSSGKLFMTSWLHHHDVINFFQSLKKHYSNRHCFRLFKNTISWAVCPRIKSIWRDDDIIMT